VLVGRRLGPEPGETGDPAATGWPRGVELRRCQQNRCAALVQLCRPSDRGHRCCSKACSTAERARCLRSARRRHRRSPERQADHREAERARARAGDHGSLVFLWNSHTPRSTWRCTMARRATLPQLRQAKVDGCTRLSLTSLVPDSLPPPALCQLLSRLAFSSGQRLDVVLDGAGSDERHLRILTGSLIDARQRERHPQQASSGNVPGTLGGAPSFA
jgi:hypothetical protein